MIVIGCPVYERGWILPHWFDHLYVAVSTAPRVYSSSTRFVFAYTPSEDDTLEVIEEKTSEYDWDYEVVEVEEGTHSTERNWSKKGRIETMAMLRNKLLERVVAHEPEYFFSLDSDILVPFDAVSGLMKAINDTNYDAVSPLLYLASGPGITNAFYRDRHVFRRVTVLEGLQPADVLCAAVMMTGEVAANTKYDHFPRGEDFAWSESAQAMGFKLGIDTRIKAKHVMEPSQLTQEDPRVGF